MPLGPARRPRRSPALGALVVVIALGLGLAGCSGSDDAGGQPDATAAAFVQAVTNGDFASLPVFVAHAGTEKPPASSASISQEYAKIVKGMGEAKPTVSLGEVTTNGDSASAVVHWSWPLGSTAAPVTWAYDSTIRLTREQDKWFVGWGPDDVAPGLGQGQVLSAAALAPERGEILGKGDSPIVVERAVVRVGIDRTQVKAARAASSARSLARLTDVDADGFAAKVKAAGPEAFVEAITYRRGEVPPAVENGLRSVDGAREVSASLPLAPTAAFAAPLLGTVGDVTADMIKQHPDTYAAGDIAGLSGLQARYDDQLRGTSGVRVSAVASDGRTTSLFEQPATDGSPLHLTLEPQLQTTAERLLSDVGPASALVAIKPSTGAVLAAANGPGNDGQNFATYGQYPPGSTFKSVSALALLRAGLTPDSTVDCSPSITVDGRRFTNYSDYPSSALGRISLLTAVANSCNTGVISQAGKLSSDDLADAAASLGLGVDHEVGYPAYFGSVQAASGPTEEAADMIGQGTVLASPLAMATVIASIQHGTTVVPQLVTDEPDLDVDPPADAAPLTSREDAQLTRMLRAVVTEGSGRLLAGLPGPPVIAKTGTAEFDGKGGVQTHAWMIAAQGDLAVAVFVDLGASGSGTAGPILADFLRAAR